MNGENGPGLVLLCVLAATSHQPPGHAPGQALHLARIGAASGARQQPPVATGSDSGSHAILKFWVPFHPSRHATSQLP